MDPFNIVKDSSIWYDKSQYSAINKFDSSIRVGVIKKALNSGFTNELRYLVEVQNHGDKIEMNCTMMRRFGGVYNYEDFIMRGYAISDSVDPVAAFDAKAGDAVIVCHLNGHGREGIILGGINHAARNSKINATDGPQYLSEFNGLETSINADGEYLITFKGQPTNLTKLNEVPKDRLLPATYDVAVGTSFYKFDKTGSYTVSDNSLTGSQFLKLDKPNGVLYMVSGAVSLKITKDTEAVEWLCKTMDTKATNKISSTTKEFTVDATTKAYIKTPKVAIGTDTIELLDQLAKLIDALGAVQPISPIGRCTSLNSSLMWGQVEAIKGKIKQITGSF